MLLIKATYLLTYSLVRVPLTFTSATRPAVNWRIPGHIQKSTENISEK